MTLDDDITILASNFDKLDLAVYAQHFDDTFLKQLEELKAKAIANKGPLPIELKPLKSVDVWKGFLQPHGANGYAFLIFGNEYNLKIGNWVEAIDRPSVYVEIRSETLWHLGPAAAIDRIIDILKGQGKGAIVEKIVPSRVDLCVDALFPLSVWDRSLLDYKVTHRPTKTALYLDKSGEIEGVSIGRGKLSCRLYNKPLEIKTQSKKFWMFDVWGIAADDVPKHMRIIRTEFQLRREVLKQLAIDTADDLIDYQGSLWGHCTKEWLRFRDQPGKHSKVRKTFGWWKTLQNGYHGIHAPIPLIRFKAANAQHEHLLNQLDGLLTSREALLQETFAPDSHLQPVRSIALKTLPSALNAIGKDICHFMDAVNEKRAKYKRSKEKAALVAEQRATLGHPCNLENNGNYHQTTLEEVANGTVPDNGGTE
ncbi:hypothetical protein [uncultured Desulfosarcina sp.]|uniref:hypothetical protein n=1 Tax=uncultured Desulfosarcina sp. TaxID=218289 RepID=UPI0029C69182|nr:hypothetical protein [uncultured Desulfosarcina sp.]